MGSEKFGAPDIYTQSPRSTSPAKADSTPVRGDDEAHASIPQAEAPALFGDYAVEDGAWIPRWRKV